MSLTRGIHTTLRRLWKNTGLLSTGTGTCSRPSQDPRLYSVFEPDDVNLEPEIPEYDTLNIRMTSYDFVTLEGYAKYAHNIADKLGLETNTWPVPARTCTVQTFKANSAATESEYHVAKYDRTLQVEDVPSTTLPLLLDILQQHQPEGVTVAVAEPDPDEEELRYVPDLILQELQLQLGDIEQAREDRKKK